ncbi:MAG: amidohydrolase family protein [Candidatus Brockarchaeota archaeon]|nr:amidohydrolase family protein [Candidatus Brockarchaeota archaeon]
MNCAVAEFARIPVIDCHMHVTSIQETGNLLEIVSEAGFHRTSLLSIIDDKRVNFNPEVLCLKALHPEMFYAFGSLDYSFVFTSSKPQPLRDQVDRLLNIGFDGVKMVEGKPVCRKILKIRFDDPFYEDYFARLEETGLPLLFHVADPEEFWDPVKVPVWAREQGWFYDQTYPPKQQFYKEVDTVLEKHPGLKVVFAHFYFLSADIAAASSFLEKYKNVHLDLTPGIEMYHNFSMKREAWREFFVKYEDRILFGTDIFGGERIESALAKVQLVRGFLETDEGLNLPRHTLEKVYCSNFQRIVGPRPRKLDFDLAVEECGRLAREEALLSSRPLEETVAWTVAGKIRSLA